MNPALRLEWVTLPNGIQMSGPIEYFVEPHRSATTGQRIDNYKIWKREPDGRAQMCCDANTAALARRIAERYAREDHERITRLEAFAFAGGVLEHLCPSIVAKVLKQVSPALELAGLSSDRLKLLASDMRELASREASRWADQFRRDLAFARRDVRGAEAIADLASTLPREVPAEGYVADGHERGG
jgi:hypothetical protein